MDTRNTIDHSNRIRDAVVEHLRHHSVADSTYTKYNKSLIVWQRWTRLNGVNLWLSAMTDEQRVTHISNFAVDGLYKGFGSGRQVRSSTIAATLLGIRHFFWASGLSFPQGHPQVRMLLKGISYLDQPSHQKEPVSIEIMEACFSALDLAKPTDQALWGGVLCLALFFLLRRSEIAAINTKSFKWFALQAKDIAVLDDQGAVTHVPGRAKSVHIRLRGSKTNQQGTPVNRTLGRSGHSYVCPVFGALILLRSRGNLPMDIPAAVFLDEHGKPNSVTSAKRTTAIKAAALATGANPASFGTHSLRSGGATLMYRAGVDDLTIQFHGRWASDAFKLFTRLCNESVDSIATKIVSGSKQSATLQNRHFERHSKRGAQL